jgi:predicted phage tail protein
MSLHSLESERNSILDRMQMSRTGFRHMLSDDEDEMRHAVADLHHEPASVSPHHPAHAQARARPFPRSVTMTLLTRHPFACALAVAAVVVIGPRRLVRAAAKSSGMVSALTLRNQANVDMISRLIALAGQQLAQRSRTRHTPR